MGNKSTPAIDIEQLFLVAKNYLANCRAETSVEPDGVNPENEKAPAFTEAFELVGQLLSAN